MSSKKSHVILVVDDEKKVCDILSSILIRVNYDVIQALDGMTALEKMQKHRPDLIFMDIFMPGLDGLEVLKKMKETKLNIPVIIMTGRSSMDTAIKAIRHGAYDYMAKPFHINKVEALTKRCLEEKAYERSIKQKKGKKIETRSRYDIIGSSDPMIEVYKSIGAVSRTNNTTNVLILGESGTGKELVAQQIHSWGEESNSPFIPVNITALPDSLIESELFGYEKGAFTGADQQKTGKFEQAGEGTLFLDEIGGLSINLQKKVLRVLQEREFFRLGGMKMVPVKCRIVAATNDNLPKMIEDGEFRRDLYFRLKVVTIQLPPLKDRSDDIPRLAEYFIQRQAIEMNCRPPELSKESVLLLYEYEWPGNVRELQNAIAQAMVFKHGDILTPKNFPDILDPEINQPNHIDSSLTIERARKISNESFEKQYIKDGLKISNGNVAEAAENAGISPQRYYQLLKKYSISLDDYK